MKILIIKYNRETLEIVNNLSKDNIVIAVCDPDLNGQILAQHDLPGIKCYVDTSLAIRDSGCDAVLLTISDHAPQLALLAMAYGKKVLWASGVTPGKYAKELMIISERVGIEMRIGL